MDVSHGWMDVIRNTLRRFDNTGFHLGHIARLDLPESAYDAVVVHFVLHDIPKVERPEVVKALARRLKPGGRLLLFLCRFFTGLGQLICNPPGTG